MNMMNYSTEARTVPVRSAQEQAAVLDNPERPGAVGATASRDGSRSDPELDSSLRNRAFTLIELVVVLALIAMGSAMLATGLAHTRPNVRLIQCLSNKHQVARACSMYSHDWNDYLLPNASGDPRTWCPGYESWMTAGANTNRDYYSTNCLASYVAGNIKVYKCPGDTIPSDNGDRIRSISMNSQMVGAIPAHNYNTGWRIYKKVSDLTSPTPAMAWIICDESMASINDSYLQMNLNEDGDYPDVPAAYHGAINCFTFGDGHADAHKWDRNGKLWNWPLVPVYYPPGHWPSDAQDRDWYWLRDRTSALQ